MEITTDYSYYCYLKEHSSSTRKLQPLCSHSVAIIIKTLNLLPDGLAKSFLTQSLVWFFFFRRRVAFLSLLSFFKDTLINYSFAVLDGAGKPGTTLLITMATIML